MTLEAVAEALDMTHASLSRIERGLQPYSQPILEALADLYGTDVPNLLMRDPSNPDAMWSIWEQAQDGQREKIEAYAQFVRNSEIASIPAHVRRKQ